MVSSGVGIEEIFDVQRSDNVVDLLMVDRYTGVTRVAKVGD